MHRRVTNISTELPDDQRFSFEPAGALEFINELSGFAVALAPISLSQNPGMHVPTSNVARQVVTHGYHSDKPLQSLCRPGMV